MNQGLGFRVLIVEDNPDTRWAFSEVLTDDGYEIETAGTAEDGLSQLGEPNPDGVAGIKVLRKPIDTDLLLREVFEILAPTRIKELEPDQRGI